MKLALTAALVAAVAVAGAAAAPKQEISTRDCRSRGDPSDGSAIRFARAGDVVVGPVSFAGLASAASTTRLDRGDDGRFGRKVAAKVLWGLPVTVSVVPTDRARLALAYARSNLLTDSIRFEPCPPGTRMFGGNGRLRRVTVFPGGFSFTTRGCYALEVTAGSRVYRRTVSLGAGRCR
jgi:hypothetical protein